MECIARFGGRLMVAPIPLRAHTAGQADPNQHDQQELSASVGRNLRNLRARSGYSLEHLAQLSGVSRAMLSQIELGRSTPSIKVTFKIARAFGVPFSTLLTDQPKPGTRMLPAARSKILASASGQFSTRALFPHDAQQKTEFYELRLAAGGVEQADAHPEGTIENLVVVSGVVEVTIGSERNRLSPGDALFFQADSPHSYSNLAEHEALLYLVMTYPAHLL
jgi:transcriptional regulator with XRE-family HTH domain